MRHSSSERPLALVPAWIVACLAAALAIQLGWQWMHRAASTAAADLPPAPSPAVFRLAGFGETAAQARLAMLWLLSFDSSGTNAIAYQHLDYGRLRGWLQAALDTDPRSEFPLFAASRVYAEVRDEARARAMFDFVHEAFDKDPNRRWPALAQVALLAKHRLGDLALARRYAAELQARTTDPSVPSWARQMEIFILEDMNELEAARIMLGGLLVTGRVRDPEERRFLEERLKEIEVRIARQPSRSLR